MSWLLEDGRFCSDTSLKAIGETGYGETGNGEREIGELGFGEMGRHRMTA